MYKIYCIKGNTPEPTFVYSFDSLEQAEHSLVRLVALEPQYLWYIE